MNKHFDEDHKQDDDGMSTVQVLDISSKAIDFVWTKLFDIDEQESKEISTKEDRSKNISTDEMIKLIGIAKDAWAMAIDVVQFDLATSGLGPGDDDFDDDFDDDDDEIDNEK